VELPDDDWEGIADTAFSRARAAWRARISGGEIAFGIFAFVSTPFALARAVVDGVSAAPPITAACIKNCLRDEAMIVLL
jgi:hypothetical protein